MKRQPNNIFLDRFHRGFVVACIGLTIFGTATMFNSIYHYFAVTKPTLVAERKAALAEMPVINEENIDIAHQLKA